MKPPHRCFKFKKTDIYIITTIISLILVYVIASILFPNPDASAIVLNSEIVVFWYQSGRPVLTCKLSPGSTGSREIVTLLEVHRGQWMLDFVSYAPSLLIRGEDFSIDVRDDVIVLSYVHHGRDIQVISPARKFESERMFNVLRAYWRRFEE